MQQLSYISDANVTTEEKVTTILETLDRLDQQITDLHAQAADLERAGICTGSAHWRDANHDGRTPKLYALHRLDEACPLHGKPGSGQRLRVYIGTDPEKQNRVRAAIERREQKADLENQIRQIEIHRDRIERAIATAWRAATGSQGWEW